MRIPALLIIALSLLIITGCRTVMVVPAPAPVTVVHAPPPHAPAHGYRYHYHDHDLEYDSNLGVYLVLGYDGVYFNNDLSLRFYAGEWQAVERLNGPWHRAEYQRVPSKLRENRRFKRNKRYAPPPHAPAHGYRHHHPQGVDLVFDSDLGVYLVQGFNDLYFSDGLYLRFFDGNWHVADRYDGRWRRAEHRQVPTGLWRNMRYYRQQRQSPPPLAPRQGYRHHYYDVDLVFDSGIGAYIVLGFDDLFFYDGRYLRFYNNQWQSSDRYNGRWRRADERYVPRKLRTVRRQEKQGLFNRIKQQYRSDYQDERDYRERHNVREKNGNRDDHKGNHQNTNREGNRDRDHRTERKDNNKKGLFKNVKKQHEEKEALRNEQKKTRDDDKDENLDTDETEENQRDNGNRF